MGWNGVERRRFTRASLSCRLNIGSGKETMMVKTKNIGAGGIRVVLKKEIPMNTSLNMELFLEDNKVIFCKAYVVWVMQRTNPLNSSELLYDIGMQFEDIKEADRAVILKLVDRYSRSQDKNDNDK